MRWIANIARVLVGIEFIFSGFVKVVDPYGTGLKFQEYFEVFAQDLPFLSGFFELLAGQAQILSLLFCALELILGVALLFNFRMKWTAWVVLLLMSFFTFLTFYSAYFNKVTDCGCFGDFMKLKPWTSFYKDVISLAVILIIFAFRKKYNEWAFSPIAVIVGTIVAFGIGIYAKRHLPPLDFLPYAEGLSIKEQMQPTGVKPIIEYTFLDKSSGDYFESQEYLMDTTKYKYESSVILNEDDLRPKITDFSIGTASGDDFTQEVLEGNKLLIALKKTKGVDSDNIRKIQVLGENSKVPTFIISSLLDEELNSFKEENNIEIEGLTIDEKVLKTMARTNPCILLLSNGVVVKKWSHIDTPSVEEVNSLIK